jgi:hypothetical protein
MKVRQVDPRDVAWEIDFPSYRVYFWKPDPPPVGVRDHPVGFSSNEFELSGVSDVGEVLAWIEASASPGSIYTLWVVVVQGDERGLVRLAGEDPTAAA